MSLKRTCRIGIIDLKINNLFSIYNACVKAGYKVNIIEPKKKFLNYDLILLPGVGSFKSGMNFLKKNYIDEKIFDYLNKKNSFLYGICLGMQLLFNNSNEFSITKGLSLIDGKVRKLQNNKLNKNINIGWNKLEFNKNEFKEIFSNFKKSHFYFIHSFYVNPKNLSENIADSKHENFKFCSIIKKNNIFGTQFHPEKSGEHGIKFLKMIKKII